MNKLFILIAISFMAGCKMAPPSISHSGSLDLEGYDRAYQGTRCERQAFDESTWDKIEIELRDRPR